MNHFGKMIRAYRCGHGLEQQAMAEIIGVQPHQLHRAEMHRADAETAARILAWALTDSPLPDPRQMQVALSAPAEGVTA